MDKEETGSTTALLGEAPCGTLVVPDAPTESGSASAGALGAGGNPTGATVNTGSTVGSTEATSPNATTDGSSG